MALPMVNTHPLDLTSTSKSRSASSKSAKLSAKAWFLTLPKCQVDRKEALKKLLAHFESDPTKGLQFIKFIRVATELHEDGTPHLHIFLLFAKPLSTRKRDYFNFIGSKHGNYQTCRSAIGSLKYVSKKGEFEDYGDLPSELAMQLTRKRGRGDDPAFEQDTRPAKQGKWAQFAALMIAGSSADDICSLDPGFYMMNRKKVDDFEAYCLNIQHRLPTKKHPGVINYTGSHTPTKLVVDWFNRNMLGGPREFKQKQLYIWGPGNMLKSTLISRFSEFFKTYWVPTLEDWYDEYSDNVELCVIDEFEGQKKIPWMNLFLQGGPTTLAKKGSHYTKRKNPGVVILSNFSLDMNYYPKSVDTMNLRLETVYTCSPFDLDNIHHITAETANPTVSDDETATTVDFNQTQSPSLDESLSSTLVVSPSAVFEDDQSSAVDAPNQEDNPAVMGLISLVQARSKFSALYSDSVVSRAIASLEALDLRTENLRLKGKQPESEPDDECILTTPTFSDSEEEEAEYQKRHNKFMFEIEDADEEPSK